MSRAVACAQVVRRVCWWVDFGSGHAACMTANTCILLSAVSATLQARTAARAIFYGCTAVDGGERAVMYDRLQGVLPQPIGEGTHVRIPWLQNPTIMDIRTRPRSISSVTGTQGALESQLAAHPQCPFIASESVSQVLGARPAWLSAANAPHAMVTR